MRERKSLQFGIRMALAAFAAVVAMLVAVSPSLAGGYNPPTAGQSPHGGYADSTTKCKVCHAVHNASTDATLGASPQTLLRSSRGVPNGFPRETPDSSHPCVYCHITGEWAINKVYNGILSNFTTDSRMNHDDTHRAQNWGEANYAGCISCHSVHGSNCLPGYENEIVRADPNPNRAFTVTDLTDFCRDCHEDQTYPGGPYGGQYGSRCGFCHNSMFVEPGGTDGSDFTDQYPPFYTEDRNGTTHIMTTTLSGNYGTQVAWSASDDCRDCHSGGNYTAGNSFPHFTAGAQFLDDGYTTADTQMDRVCLNCHVEGGDGAAYTTGVGKTF
ncbi:MAG: hypothetical protein C4521_06460 [Actinobacteria bacterium]|nr:MAG: hypothetical protein C4521_06460 [Actinomycetota bacterium]